MHNRKFAEHLNSALDAIGAPEERAERIAVFSKLVKITKFKAETLLDGLAVPDDTLLDKIAMELEVNPEWLLGKSSTRGP